MTAKAKNRRALDRLYILAREFEENKGSYAGFIQEFSKYAAAKGVKITILAGMASAKQKSSEKLKYAEILRFPLAKFKPPILGMNSDYIALSRSIRKYLKHNPPGKNSILLANSRAALGAKGHKYVLRMGQPALTFLANMEIAKGESRFLSRTARALHFWALSLIERHTVRRAAAYLFPSAETRNKVSEHYGIGGRPSFIPFAGIKYRELQGGKKLKIPGRLILFIAQGNAERIRKGVMHFERVLPEIFRKYDDVKVLHVGGEFDWNIPKEFKNRIISAGKVPWHKMRDYYSTADVMVSCALNEGFPNAVLEAMAAGTPIVTSDINGIGEYITDSENGLIYKRGDLDSLKRTIIRLLDDKELRLKLGRAARARAKNLDYQKVAKSLIEYLEKVAGGKKPKSYNLLRRGSNEKK